MIPTRGMDGGPLPSHVYIGFKKIMSEDFWGRLLKRFDNFSVSRGVGLPSRSDVTDGINNQFYTPRLGTCLVRKFESTVGLFAEPVCI